MLNLICLNCGKEFNKPHNPKRYYKFCSYQCRADFNSKQVRITKNCEYCGQEFSVIDWYKSQKCCSKKCADKLKDKGRTSEAQRIRTSNEYKDWRKSVFERDNYTCKECGQIGGKLCADHIKRFSEYPKLRLDVDNGRTLCECCHRQTENYGNRKVIVLNISTDTKWDLLAVLNNF